MTSRSKFPRLLPLALLAALLRPAAAQDPFAKDEADLVRHCVGALSTFASTAKSQKVGQRAKQAFDLVLQYDADNSSARNELGFRKEKDKWIELPPDKRKKWLDKATYEGRFKVAQAWYDTSVKLGELHRKLGLKMKDAGNQVRATYHLEKAVYYNAMDKEANLGLGYKEGPGFYGTDSQIAFATRMKDLEKKAVEIARKDYEVTALGDDAMPTELKQFQENAPDWMKKPNLEITGAKSKHFTVWVRGTQDHAMTSAKWAERALDWAVALLGEERVKKLRFVEKATGAFKWYGFLATASEREEFLKANPNVWEGEGNIDRAKEFANNMWNSSQGPAVVMVRVQPASVHDSLIGYVWMQGLVAQRNDGLGQGIIHAMTWYLKSTSEVRWGARPEGTVGEDSLDLPDGANWWMRAVRDQAVSSQDWALNQVPREKLSRFRNDCRLKSWSFMTWVLAAYPDKWLDFFLALPDLEAKIPTLEEVDAIGLKAFGKSLAEIDTEWREWARGDSGVAFATGYGPPLLPDRPSKEELAAVERLNLVRGQLVAFSWPKTDMRDGTFAGMPPCELDAEASLGCEAHASYVCTYPELEKSQNLEIHEEDPAKPEFSRKGQLAAGGNIVTSHGERGVDFARDTVDMWMGAPFHRFPLLEHNIRRIGYAYVVKDDFSCAVLDMGSLEEPYDPSAAPKLIAWPPHNMRDVPTHFGSPEEPNPLADQPEGQQDVTKCGYAVSLQFQKEVALVMKEATIELYESRKSGKQPPKNLVLKDSAEWRGWAERCKPNAVAIHVHTPKIPLNKKRDMKDVLFLLPKEPLDANTQYQVRAMLRMGTADPLWFIWEFTTGSQKDGLKLK